MVLKTELCRFSGQKIYPGRGIRFIRSDSQVFLFLNSKCKRYFHNKLKPSKLAWTAMYRKQHKKDAAQEAVKRRRRATKKPYSRSIVGATLEVIQKKRAEKPEVRDAAREAALREIKERIKKTTMLTASAGISINKFLAKTASDVNKPDGLFLIRPKAAVEYVEKLPIERFFGVGKVTAQKMHDLGINNGYDLKQLSENELKRHFGKVGHYYYKIARAEDDHVPVFHLPQRPNVLAGFRLQPGQHTTGSDAVIGGLQPGAVDP